MAQQPAQEDSTDHAVEGRLEVLEGVLMSIQEMSSAAETRFCALETAVQEKAGATLVEQLQHGVQEMLEQLERAERARPPISALPESGDVSADEADERIDLVLRSLQDMVSILEANMAGQQVHVDGTPQQHQQQVEETV